MNKSVDSVHSLKCYESLARLSMSPLDQLTIHVHNDVVFVMTGRTCPDGFEKDQVS